MKPKSETAVTRALRGERQGLVDEFISQIPGSCNIAVDVDRDEQNSVFWVAKTQGGLRTVIAGVPAAAIMIATTNAANCR